MVALVELIMGRARWVHRGMRAQNEAIQNTPPLEREQSSTSSKERMFILFAREEPEYTKTHYRGSPYLTAACCEAE